jgi:alkanesulfonate monooxygenase SsuD/methylene tetrahydromethanopterin reductase-like flavin-dependent oxidoreductase (luciferase family)
VLRCRQPPIGTLTVDGGRLDVQTAFHHIDRAGIKPLLDRPIPIWFGGFSEAQQERCAQLGDGFILMRDSSLTRRGVDFVRTRAAEVGRDPGSIRFQATIAPAEGQTFEQALSAH